MPEYHFSYSKQDHPLFWGHETENEIGYNILCHNDSN